MATSAKNFTINKGFVNEFILTIKQNKTLLPMVITDTDTFKLSLINQDTEQTEFELDMDNQDPNGYIAIHNDVNGQIKIVMNKVMTDRLEKERGPKEDRYYLKPTYRILLEGNTTNNGYQVSKLNNVYID